jgi:hypothetical protein
MAIRASIGTAAPTPAPIPMLSQSLVPPEGLSSAALVDATATIGTLEVGISDLLSVMVTILDHCSVPRLLRSKYNCTSYPILSLLTDQ